MASKGSVSQKNNNKKTCEIFSFSKFLGSSCNFILSLKLLQQVSLMFSRLLLIYLTQGQQQLYL